MVQLFLLAPMIRKRPNKQICSIPTCFQKKIITYEFFYAHYNCNKVYTLHIFLCHQQNVCVVKLVVMCSKKTQIFMKILLNVITSRYNPETDKLGMSYSEFKTEDLSKLGHLSIFVLEKLTLLDVHRNVGEDNKYMR